MSWSFKSRLPKSLPHEPEKRTGRRARGGRHERRQRWPGTPAYHAAGAAVSASGAGHTWIHGAAGQGGRELAITAAAAAPASATAPDRPELVSYDQGAGAAGDE